MIPTSTEPVLRRDQWPPGYRKSPDSAVRLGNNFIYPLQLRPVLSQDSSNIQLTHSIL